MAIIRSNSISGINSITAQASSLAFYDSAGSSLSLDTGNVDAEVITATSINATTGTFSGNLNVAGVLTYEDVTNVDSIGIVTARSGIKVLSGGANITGIVTASAGFQFGSTPSYLYGTGTDSVFLRVGDGPYAEFIDAGSNILELGNASGALALTSSGTEKVRITPSGSVGIGTDNPDGQLTIRKQILLSDTISNTVSHLSLVSNLGGSNPHQSVIHFGPRNASTNTSPAAIAAIASGNTASDLAFYVNANNNYSSTPNTEVLRISNLGNVGINTYPGDSLDILGGFRVQGNIRTRNYYKTGTTSQQQYTLKDTLANSAFEADPLCHPFLMNDLASFIARGGTYAFGGLTSTPGGLGQLFSTQGHVYFGNSLYSGSTFTITLTNLPRNLNYGTFIGITFGSAAFSPSSCKIETSDNGGGTWTTRLDHTGSQFNYFTRVDASGSGINAIRYTIGQGNSGGVRIQSLWGFNYNSHGMEHYFMPRSGGQLYGNMSFPSGNGIDFSATADGGTTTPSELLDDYEEGTWTPNFTGVTYTASVQFGRYTKIGRYVYCTITIDGSISDGSSNIGLEGLPFSADEASDNGQRSSWHPANGGHMAGLSINDARFRVNGSTMQGVKGATGNTTYMTGDQLTSGTFQFTGDFSYYTSS